MKIYQIWFLIIISFISCNINQKATKESIFSKQYHSFDEIKCFENFDNIGFAIVGDFNVGDFNEDGFNLYEFKKDNLTVLVFTKINSGSSSFEILDTLHINNIEKTEHIEYQTCIKDSIGDPEIIAIVVSGNRQYDTIARKAWKANREIKKIIEIDPKGVECYNMGYGV